MGDKVGMKGCKRQSCCEIHIEQSSEGCCAYNIAGHEAEDGRRILRFLYDLGTKGGCVVASSECSTIEIAQAQACRRMFVESGGLGYVRRTRPDVAALQTALQEAEAERDELLGKPCSKCNGTRIVSGGRPNDARVCKCTATLSGVAKRNFKRAEEAERKIELLQPQWSDDLPTEHGDYWERRKITVGQAVTPEGEYQGEIISDEEGEINWPEHHSTANRQWCKVTPPQTGDKR